MSIVKNKSIQFIDPYPVLYALGMMLFGLGIFMLICSLVDWFYGDEDVFVFLKYGIITAFSGTCLFFIGRSSNKNMHVREFFLLTSVTWIVLPIFAALPLYSSNINIDYSAAFFEAMSGFTTTGSTVLSHLDNMDKGVLLWRSIIQWLGGVGIVTMALSIFPLLNVGGMKLFYLEFTYKLEKALPRATQIGIRISVVYLVLTIICALLLKIAGMSYFDAINHAMTTLSTGGYSTHDLSIGYYHSLSIEIILEVFMIVAAMPLILFFYMMFFFTLKPVFKDSQTRAMLMLFVVAVFAMLAYRIYTSNSGSVILVIRQTVFNVISMGTGTGFSSANFSTWGALSAPLFTFLMIIGGCAGSASCGIKIFRFQILIRVFKNQLHKLINPKKIIVVKYDNKPIDRSILESVSSFFFIYLVITAIVAIILSVSGLDFTTALSASVTTISNVGPGVGSTVGPAGNFGTIGDVNDWILSFNMLIGRLELFPIFILFMKKFWESN